MSDTTTLHQTDPTALSQALAFLEAYVFFILSLLWTFLQNQFPSMKPVAPTPEQIERESRLAHERRRSRRSSSVSTVNSTSSTLVDNASRSSSGKLPTLSMMAKALSRITEVSYNEPPTPPLRPIRRSRLSSIRSSISKPVQKISTQFTTAFVSLSKDVKVMKVPATKLPVVKRLRSMSLSDIPYTKPASTTMISMSTPTRPPRPSATRSPSLRFSNLSLNALRISIPGPVAKSTSLEKYESIYDGLHEADSLHPHPCTSLQGGEPRSYFETPDPEVVRVEEIRGEQEQEAKVESTGTKVGVEEKEKIKVVVEEVVVEQVSRKGEKTALRMKRTMTKVKSILRIKSSRV